MSTELVALHRLTQLIMGLQVNLTQHCDKLNAGACCTGSMGFMGLSNLDSVFKQLLNKDVTRASWATEFINGLTKQLYNMLHGLHWLTMGLQSL